MSKSLRKMVLAALFIALGVVIPQLFHLVGVQNAGGTFLPMHIPVLIAGYVCGGFYGLICGAITPFISSIMTGMPPAARLPYMVVELATYGCVAGVWYRGLKGSSLRVIISLVIALVCGRITYGLALAALSGFNNVAGNIAAVKAAVIMGVPGIVIQLILIPLVVGLLQKHNYIKD